MFLKSDRIERNDICYTKINIQNVQSTCKITEKGNYSIEETEKDG